MGQSSAINGCILSKFYIKPQHARSRNIQRQGCILSKFYIKPQPEGTTVVVDTVVSYRNSTSNHNIEFHWERVYPVVSYRNSTSNHNAYPVHHRRLNVVSYRNSTSNHNSRDIPSIASVLYLIEILHQTTTPFFIHCFLCRCILSKFYIKPQRRYRVREIEARCILSKFYIKPQQPAVFFVRQVGCILSKFYIKPQLHRHHPKDRKVVSYRNSTSNHNSRTWSLATDIVVSYRNSTSNHN